MNHSNFVEINRISTAMAFLRDLGLPMDIDLDMDQSPSITGNQNTPSSGDFSDELDEAIFNFNALTGGPSSLPSFTQASSDSLSESAFQGNTIQTGNGQNSYTNTGEYILGLNKQTIEVLDSPTSHHFPLHGHQPQSGATGDISEGIKLCVPHARTCMTLAQKVFDALHTPPTVCLSVYSNISTEDAFPRRKVDSILSINRQAIQAVSQILKCVCSTGSSMQLVLVSICNKVTSWYQALVSTNIQQNQTSEDNGFFASPQLATRADIANNKMHPRNNHNNDRDIVSDDYSHHVIHQPLSLGAYVFDFTLDSRLRAQVVQSELQKMEHMISYLCNHIKETEFGACMAFQNTKNTVTRNSITTRASNVTNGSSEYEEPKQENHFFEENPMQGLASFLNWQLQTVKADIAAVLDSSQ